MRKVLLLLFTLYATVSVSQNIDKETIAAIEFLRQGYVQYGVAELKKAATANDLAAQFFLATCYSKGIGVELNNSEAFKLYRKTAERGLSDGQLFLALCYKEGIGVNIDDNKYNYWLDRFKKKGGKLLLPDVNLIYKEALSNPENYSLKPKQLNVGSQLQFEDVTNRTGDAYIIVNNIINKVENSIIEPDMTQPDEIGSYNMNNKKSDIDDNIPITQKKNENTFALIIANENYNKVATVPFALRDGQKLNEYINNTLGVDKSHISLLEDATLNDMRYELNRLKKISDTYKGDVSFIVYYIGHGIPDEKSGNGYLLPVDGYGNDVTTAYPLDKLYSQLSNINSKRTILVTDACFSGANKSGDMLVAARGVAMRTKSNQAKGNLIAFSACQGDETAYSYDEKGHGLLTYYFLKKLQETGGKTTLGELEEYIVDNVGKTAIVINGKSQTPKVSVSPELKNVWREQTLVE